MLTKPLTILPRAGAAVLLLVLAAGATWGRLPPAGSVAGDYYDADLDTLYDIDPRNYGYLPRSYEYPWLYRPVYRGGTRLGPYGYGGPYLFADPDGHTGYPRAYGRYSDGYEDDDWYYDYYDRGERYYTGLDYDDRRNFRNTDYDALPPGDALDPYARPLRSRPRVGTRIDYDEWYRERSGDDGFDGVEKPEIEWYEW